MTVIDLLIEFFLSLPPLSLSLAFALSRFDLAFSLVRSDQMADNTKESFPKSKTHLGD